MHVDRLMKLAEAVEKGYHNFGDFQTVALSMNQCICHTSKLSYFSLPIDRKDLENVSYHYLGCLMAFTVLLFGDDKQKQMVWDYESGIGDEFKILNIDAEATGMLELDGETSHELFYGSLIQKVTGEQTARVIRKLLRTGKVDWKMIMLELYS